MCVKSNTLWQACNISPTQNKLLLEVLLVLLPGVWEVGWLWQNPAAGCLAQSLRLHRHAAAQGPAPICSSLEPAKQLRRILCMKLEGQYRHM